MAQVSPIEMHSLLDLKDLRCFISAYELRGFGRAATALHTAQSNVSARIHRLEQLLGSSLFERKHRSIEPTVKGDLLYRHAVRVLGEIGELQIALRENSKAA